MLHAPIVFQSDQWAKALHVTQHCTMAGRRKVYSRGGRVRGKARGKAYHRVRARARVRVRVRGGGFHTRTCIQGRVVRHAV